MKELNQNLAENLGMFLLGFRDEVVKGLQEYLSANVAFSCETI